MRLKYPLVDKPANAGDRQREALDIDERTTAFDSVVQIGNETFLESGTADTLGSIGKTRSADASNGRPSRPSAFHLAWVVDVADPCARISFLPCSHYVRGGKMTAWYRGRFLFCSFGPLYLLLCVGLAVQHTWSKASLLNYDTIAMLIAACAFISSILVFQSLRRNFSASSPSRCAVEPLESLDESVLGYMLSYIPPLMIDDLSSMAKVAPAVVFYAVFVLILLRTDTMFVNPYFLIFKYRIFRVELPSQRSVIIITSKSEIMPGETISLHEIQPSKLYYAS